MKSKRILKFISCIAAISIIITSLFVGFNAFANQSGDFNYEILDEKNCVLTDYTGTNPNVVIPSEIDGYTVTGIGDDAFSASDEDTFRITQVTIPSSVISIGETAFFGTGLSEIIIPEGVETIGQQAFDACPNLISATLPASLTNLGTSAFGFQDSNLQEINVSPDNQNYCSVDGIVFNKDMTKIIQYPVGKTASDYVIPDTVITIGESAFYDAVNLVNVVIPNSVTVIEDYAFAGTGLKTVTIPENIKYIGGWAFANGDLTTIIILSKSDFEISESTFNDGQNENFQTFIGYAGSGTEKMVNEWLEYAEADDSYEVNFKFVAIEPANLKDDATNIIVTAGKDDTIAYGATLEVTVEAQTATSVTYNITLISNGEEIQPNGTVTVKIPVPKTLDAKTCAVYRIETDGTRIDMNAVYENGYMVFSTEHFSNYVLEGKETAGSSGNEKPADTEKPVDSDTTEQNNTNNGDKNNDTSDSNTNSSKVQNTSIPDTGKKQADLSLVVMFAVVGTIAFFSVALLRAKKKTQK